MNEKTDLPHVPQDQTLKAAGEEIAKILKKYDVAGFAMLYRELQIETIIKLDASFSVVSLNEDRALRIHPPIIDQKNPGGAKKRIGDTINMLFNLAGRCLQIMQTLKMAEHNVRRRFGMAQKPQRENGKIGN